MSENRCQAVLFDMDGVLVDSEEFIAAACCAMFAEKGQLVEPEDFRPFIGTGDDRFIGGVAAKYNVKVKLPTDKERAYDIYLEMIKGKLKPLDGVIDFINKCRSLGLKTAVASSADLRKVNGNLTEIGLDHGEFDTVVCAEDVKNKKPAPDIFILAASRLQVEPNRCLVIEDAISGVSAAKAVGAMCLGITTSFSKEQLGADFHAANLAEASDEVLKW
jgi:HAD superfamily hydrolase (TIGR01509 family)